MPLYSYIISGLGAGGHTWSVSGELTAETIGAFMGLPERAMREAFIKLTQGQAEYGSPGAGACRGPYRVSKMLIEEVCQ